MSERFERPYWTWGSVYRKFADYAEALGALRPDRDDPQPAAEDPLVGRGGLRPDPRERARAALVARGAPRRGPRGAPGLDASPSRSSGGRIPPSRGGSGSARVRGACSSDEARKPGV